MRVVDNPSESRYDIFVDDTLAGFTTYRIVGDRIVFIHTEIEPAFEGQGLGSQLARGALDDARRRGLTIVARCPFIARFIREHPEYAASS